VFPPLAFEGEDLQFPIGERGPGRRYRLGHARGGDVLLLLDGLVTGRFGGGLHGTPDGIGDHGFPEGSSA
jgi:hypothetical protein